MCENNIDFKRIEFDHANEAEQREWLKRNKIAPNRYEVLDIPRTDELKKKWRATFISGVKEKRHKCPFCSQTVKRSFDWYAFSWKLVEAQEVDKDFLHEKLKDYNKDLYLLWEECCSHGLVMSSEIVRNCKWTNTDIYIFDNSFKWTFVATHEELYYYKEI